MNLRRSLGEVLAAGVVLWAPGACHKPPSAEENAGPEIPTGAPTEDSPSKAGPRPVLPARCRAAEPVLVFDQNASAADLEVGDAIEIPDGYAVGLLHRTPRGRLAAVGLLGPDANGPPHLVDLGLAMGDAPPPRLSLRDGDLIAAAYSVASESRSQSDGNGGRNLALYRVAATGPASVLANVSQQRDDSLAFDMAFASPPTQALPAQDPGRQGGMVVWDEATSAGHGVVRAVFLPSGVLPTSFLSVGDRAKPARNLSPAESDAELPRVVPNGRGYFALWIARAPERAPGGDASELEATGEARSYGWLEALALDDQGVPTSPVRRLTPTDGHVSAYDARMLAAASKPTLLVVVRDDGEAVDASGGDLLRVRVVGDTVEPAVAFSNDGLGRGAPAFVDGDPPWLVWMDAREQLRLMPLDDTGAPKGGPSAEDEMSEARPLLFLRAAADGSRRVLVASPLDATGQVRGFACAR
jgi:hypothetical protein